MLDPNEMADKNVMVIGSGGPEHAICWKLSQSVHVSKIYAVPGSFGIGQVRKCENVTVFDVRAFDDVVVYCIWHEIDLVFVGPVRPLADGIVDFLHKYGIRCLGPGKSGAKLIANKNLEKEFMRRHLIPTGFFKSFTDKNEAKEFIKTVPNALVVKVNAVKEMRMVSANEVVIADNVAEACQAVDDVWGLKLGEQTVVVEEKLCGEEMTLLAFVDSRTVSGMLLAKNYKRLHCGNKGPVTSGMGAWAPYPFPSKKCETELKATFHNSVAALRKEGIVCRGIITVTIIWTVQSGVKVVAYNFHCGDTVLEVVLPLLVSDFYEVMNACYEDRLSEIKVVWHSVAIAVGVVMVGPGYPHTLSYVDIEGIPENESLITVFHSDVTPAQVGERTSINHSNGGRILTVVRVDCAQVDAALEARNLCREIKYEGAHFRTDIGHIYD